MTVGDLLDQVAFDAVDLEGDYRTAALRWLNLLRADMAAKGPWRGALDPVATITTAAATTTGIYAITGYTMVASEWMFDETTRFPVQYDSRAVVGFADPKKTVFGPPRIWTDAGASSTTGEYQVQLWPIPQDTRTIRFPAWRRLADLTSAQEALTVDPYFGFITEFQHVFEAGLRYHHDKNANESAQQIFGQRGVYKNALDQAFKSNRVSPVTLKRLRPVAGSKMMRGRLDPAHFDNSARW